ncbi:blastoderm-specific protein 25D [Bombyx mori]|uniref:Uncharacterized protein n=1 Tax=Bombyx mori TaxID=7091 RepID=A0A8R2LYN5_BOMMO|nr:blastoderm-specific protein 25D isoform X2 [Bombyx mori]
MTSRTMYKITYVTKRQQLDGRGVQLVETLFGRPSDRVTFTQFRNGLLSVLDTDRSDPSVEPSTSDDADLELAPRYVFGSKKYGRRSRPPRPLETTSTPRASSASRLDSDHRRARHRPVCRRSSSAMESRDFESDDDYKPSAELDPGRQIDRSEALALCQGLNMEGVDRLIEHIFTQSTGTEMTVAEFFRRLDSELATTIREVRERSNTNPRTGSSESIEETRLSADNIIEAWENAGVPRPRALLAELGFKENAVNSVGLENILDEELRTLSSPVDERSLLLNAALAIARLQAKLLRERADATAAERDKLRADVADANARARLLAQEIDENHARLEAELKSNLKRAEARHAEAVRGASAEAAAERERTAVLSSRLQEEIKRRIEAETRLKVESEELKSRLEDTEVRLHRSEERVAEVERERTRLEAEVLVADRASAGRSPLSAEQGSAGEIETHIERLQLENLRLRDRIDELCAALEVQGRETVSTVVTGVDDLSAELGSLLYPNRAEECDSSPTSLDQKVLSHVEAVVKLRDLLDSLRKLSASQSTCEVCSNILDTIETLKEKIQELTEAVVMAGPERSNTCEGSTQTEQEEDSVQLTMELADTLQQHEEERNRLEALVKDLESSLEQMKAEYDKCEEYWAGKVEEERRLHGDEQRAADQRLADLAARVHDYERQFALPPIDERPKLEAQVNDLQEEFARYRRDKEAELARLRGEGAGAGGGTGGAGGGAGGAGRRELRARAARAEAAVRRLQARLAAADVLVRDLYVENCQLASRDRL